MREHLLGRLPGCRPPLLFEQGLGGSHVDDHDFTKLVFRAKVVQVGLDQLNRTAFEIIEIDFPAL